MTSAPSWSRPTSGRDDESKALAQQLREALTRRVDEEHQQWLEELRLTLKAERVVRALRLSSRPPKAGAPLPPDLSRAAHRRSLGDHDGGDLAGALGDGARRAGVLAGPHRRRAGQHPRPRPRRRA